MNKPTCKTCVYWKFSYVRDYQDSDIENHISGHCFVHSVDDAEFPERFDDDFCGEHPDFPAYLESLKEEQMAQSKTSELYEHIIDVLQENNISTIKRRRIHEALISLYEDAGCKDLKECMGVDKVFDKALEEVGAYIYLEDSNER